MRSRLRQFVEFHLPNGGYCPSRPSCQHQELDELDALEAEVEKLRGVVSHQDYLLVEVYKHKGSTASGAADK